MNLTVSSLLDVRKDTLEAIATKHGLLGISVNKRQLVDNLLQVPNAQSDLMAVASVARRGMMSVLCFVFYCR